VLKPRGCRFLMPDGRLCRSSALRGEDYCLFHHPEHAEAATEARRLGGLRRRREHTLAGAYDFSGTGSVADVQRLIDIAILDTLSLENSVARARTLLYAAHMALKCLEVGELEERVALLEAALATRTPAERPVFDLELDIDEEQPKELTP
jgi:hypothetical protein